MKRLFVAINLSDEIKNTLVEKQEELKLNFDTDPVKWVSKKNLHVTLSFLGSLKENKIDLITEKLKEIKIKPFTVDFFDLKYIPNRREAKLIWVEGKSDELNNLQERVEEKLSNLEEINYTPEEREFIPHITLGRMKSFQFKKIPLEEVPLLEDEFVDLSAQVQSIELMESKLKKGGAEYTIIKSFK